MSAREAVLAGIREALGPAPAVPEVPRAYRGPVTASAGAVDLFCERVADYRATVARVGESELPAALEAACQRRGSTRLVAAPKAAWIAADADSDAIPPADLDSYDAAVTGAALAIAETGTIVLDGNPLCGRRALTLVPDHHLCVVRAEQIVLGVADAIARLAVAAQEGRPLTFVSGPSATSDIELERVEGVHGPRQLDVIVVETSH